MTILVREYSRGRWYARNDTLFDDCRYIRKNGSWGDSMSIIRFCDGYCHSRREIIRVIKTKYPNCVKKGPNTFFVEGGSK